MGIFNAKIIIRILLNSVKLSLIVRSSPVISRYLVSINPSSSSLGSFLVDIVS
jgi:hypothetical protein